MHLGRLVQRVLDHDQATHEDPPGDEEASHLGHHIPQPAHTRGVDLLGAALLTEPDRRHLGRTALDGAAEVGVRLDPVDDQDPARLDHVPVEMDRHARHLTQLDGLHRGAHLDPEPSLVDAIVGQHRRLAGSRRAAMAAHGRHDERLKAGGLKRPQGNPHDSSELSDAPAAHADRQRPLRLDAFGQPPDSSFDSDLEVFQAGRRQSLPDEPDRRGRELAVQLARQPLERRQRRLKVEASRARLKHESQDSLARQRRRPGI